jgi:NADH:ubiquinone oxidoreductase subunit 5 (subunit L)/multisubunit Na+/H+ antiporter MnhA subunit
MGIICFGFGGALLAGRHGIPVAAALLAAGAFLHIWNHSIFKSLLFLAANAVKEHTHTTLIHRLGGLQQRIPFTGGCFALGSAAIAGCPPLNGFMSEMLLFMGFAIAGKNAGTAETVFLFWGAFFILGGIAGMALFTFARTYGLAFLGAPRSPDGLHAQEPERAFRVAMLFLALLCLGGGLAGPKLLAAFKPFLLWMAANLFPALDAPDGLAWYAAYTNGIALGIDVLAGYAACCFALVALFGLASAARQKIVNKNGSSPGTTWACGYCRPTARMQYSGASFSRSFALLLKPLTRVRARGASVQGLFPECSKVVVTCPDWLTEWWNCLLFRPSAAVAEAAKNMQSGLVNMYILYIVIALVAALTWALGWA